ncbi:MAG TPA: MFS transporter [Bauldia sp.]|nr:MFS transporter [Bauldia sp.]
MLSLPLFALSLAAFCIGTTEFVVAGILPDVARDLGVSIPTAGYLISGYAGGVAVLGPIVAIITAGLERKTTLVALVILFALGNAFCALAPSYGWLMAARVIVSLSHGSYLGLAAVVAASLVPEDKRAGAVSLVLAGITVANIVGVPLGTAIGGALGWRWTFWTICGLGIITAIGISVWVPRGERAPSTGEGILAEMRALGRQEVYLSFAVIILAAAGFFAVFAYIAPLLTDVVGVTPAALPFVLSAFGVGALVGNLAGGRLADWKLMPSVLGIFAALIVLFALVSATAHTLAVAVVVLFLWSVANFSFAAPLQTRIMNGARDAPNLASTLVSTAFNIGIAGGAALGSLALTAGVRYDQLPLLGLAGVVPALALAAVSYTWDRRRGAATA